MGLAPAFQGRRLAHADEAIVADNSDDGVAAGLDRVARVVPAAGERSSYHARNVGARAARGAAIPTSCAP